MPIAVEFFRHAIDRWSNRASALGMDSSKEALMATFAEAKPETPRLGTMRWHLFKRSIVHGVAQYLVADGWRFVVIDGRCIEVERIKPHENFGHKAVWTKRPSRFLL